MNLERVCPVFPVRSVSRALDHYRSLGFTADAYGEKAEGDPIYGFVSRGSVELHLSRTPSLDPNRNTSACYLYVDDAQAVYEAWLSAGVAGRFEAPTDTPYAMREFTYVDPDGNHLRVGSQHQRGTRRHTTEGA